MPADYQRFINTKEYQEIVKFCLNHLKEVDIPVRRVQAGTIVIKEGNDNERYFHLDNLVRRLASMKRSEWQQEVRTHFEKLQDKSSAYAFFYKDFDFASPYLKVQIKAQDTLPNPEQLVLRVDFPGTYTCLVFDFEDQFNYINKEKAGEWNKSDQVLFNIALRQVASEEIEIKEYKLARRFQAFTLFSGDFSACFLLEIEKNFSVGIGEYGSIIAIPTRGSAFVHPINHPEVMDLISLLYPEVEKFYYQDPGSITLSLYWYYRGAFYSFPAKNGREGKLLVSLPNQLHQLLN